jgi:predicted Zn-dependent peptidase
MLRTLLLVYTLANGTTVVLAPETPGATIAIHATFDAGTRHGPAAASRANQLLGEKLPGFRADLNQDRALLAIEVPPADLPATLQRLTAALHPNERDEFLARHYNARSTVIAIAGTFDAQAVLSTIKSTLGTLSAGNRRRRCAGRPMPDEPPAADVVALAYPTARSGTRDWYALNILADILGQGPRARLQTRLVDGGLATRVSEGASESPCNASLLRIQTRLAPGVAAETVTQAIDEELQRLREQLVSAEELQTAHEQERQWAAEQVSTPAGLASTAARATLYYGRPEHMHTELAGILAVTAEDVRRVARRYLPPARRVTIR